LLHFRFIGSPSFSRARNRHRINYTVKESDEPFRRLERLELSMVRNLTIAVQKSYYSTVLSRPTAAIKLHANWFVDSSTRLIVTGAKRWMVLIAEKGTGWENGSHSRLYREGGEVFQVFRARRRTVRIASDLCAKYAA
jgi:hypothetical protein